MDKEKLMKMIDTMVAAGDVNSADDSVSIVYKKGQDEDYDHRLEMNGSGSSIFAAICEITSIWAVASSPEDRAGREEQVRIIADACINALKKEDYVNALKRYLQVR